MWAGTTRGKAKHTSADCLLKRVIQSECVLNNENCDRNETPAMVGQNI